MINSKTNLKAHLLLGVSVLLLGGCEFIEKIEAGGGPKKCVGGGIKKAEVQELLTNNAKQYENRIKHLENIIKSMGVNVDEMLVAPQINEMQEHAELPPMYGAMQQPIVQAQSLPQVQTNGMPQATQQPMAMPQNMFSRDTQHVAQQPSHSWQNPNIQPAQQNMQQAATPYAPQQYQQQPQYPQQQAYYQPNMQQQLPYQTQQHAAPTSGAVINFRTGLQKGGAVRLVFDTTGFTNVRKQINGNVMTIDLPGFAWNGSTSGYLGKNPLISSYNTQPLQGEAGTRLTLNLKKLAYPGQEGRILPNKDSSTHRIFMDIVPQ